MAQGIALLIGVKDVSTGGLGCEHDVDKMAEVISSVGDCTINILKTELATASAILTCIKSAADTLVAGDMFVFYFSGHGSQIKTKVSRAEPDGYSETLCTYASTIVDKELATLWQKFRSGIRIVMLSDCCHSGTNYIGAQTAQEATHRQTIQREKKPISFAGKIPESKMKAQLIHFGACRDDKDSAAGASGGAFTLALVDVWKSGNFTGYKQFHEAIKANLKAYREKKYPTPQFNKYGKIAPAFLNSKPFSL